MSEKPQDSEDSLRQRAEGLFSGSSGESPKDTPVADAALAHEMAAFQTELELQNDELRTAQGALQESRDRFAALFENAPVGYVLLDAAGIVRRANNTWKTQLNRQEEDLQGVPFAETLTAEDAPLFRARFRAFFRNPEGKRMVVRMQRKGGQPFFAQVEARPSILRHPHSAGPYDELMISVSDVSDLQVAWQQIRARNQELEVSSRRQERLNSILRAIRSVNRLITRENDPGTLVQAVCETLTGTLSYHHAWIALLDETASRVMATASSGFQRLFDPMQECLAAGDYPSCMRQAIESDRIVSLSNPETQCGQCPAYEEYAGSAGWGRSLRYAGRNYGVLSVSIPSDFAEDADEQALFEELAGDLAFGLHKIALQALQRRTEEELRLSEQKFARAFLSSPDALMLTTLADGRIVEVNSGFTRITGFTPEEAVGRTTTELALWVDPQARKRYSTAVQRKAWVSNFESTFRAKSGAEITGLISGTTIATDQGMLLLSVVRDITERKQAEESLRRAEATIRARERYLHTILQTNKDGFWVIDSHGRIIEANDAYSQLSGYSRDELLNLGIPDLEAIETPSETAARTQRIIQNGSELFETFHRRKDGSLWPVEVSVTWMEENGGQFVCFCRDLSERRKREERIALLGQMLDSAPASITIHNAEGRFLFANRITASLHGYSDESEFLALNLHDLDAAPSEVLINQRVREIAEKGEARFEVEHLRKDGSTFPLEVLAKIIDWEGQPAILSIAADITERRRADQALRHSHELLRYIIEHANSAVAVHDRDLRYVYVSQRYLEQYKVQAKEIIGRHHYEVFPDLPQKWRDVHQRALRGEVSSADEDPYYRSDGTVEWTRWECRPWHEADGTIGGFIVYTEVITERVEAEEALRQSEAFQRATIEASPLAIVSLDLAGRVQSWNAAAERIFGWEAIEVLGRVPPFVSEDPTEESAEMWTQVVAGKAFSQVELTRRRKDGSSIAISLSTAPIRDKEGRINAVMGVLEDITERKRAGNELARREALLQKIFEILPVGLWLTDSKGTLIRNNPAGVRIWGGEPHGGVSDYGVFKAWRLPSRKPVKADEWALARTVRTGETILDELLEIESFDGKRKTILHSSAPVMDDQGNVEGAIGVNVDITDRQTLEEQLRQAQKMESVGRLAGGVAHDFNNMLGVIIGNAEMAAEILSPADPLQGELQEILKAAKRSSEITRQLLAFARKQTISPQVLDLNETVEGMLRMLRRLIGENINLVWRPGKNLWPIKMDPSQLDQILANLSVNARDAISGVGRLTIETGTVTFDEASCANHPEVQQGDFVLLTVSDDGCGMDRETLTRLFEPFFTTKELGKGTGLGLATVYGIVRQNHGFINVYSEPGQGTTFKIYLARYDGETAGIRKALLEPMPKGRGETILIVEDEIAFQSLSKTMLARLGYTVLTAPGPSEALRLVESYSGPIHLLLTDVVMPEMNGRVLARELNKISAGIKVLFMSGYTANVIAHQGVLDEAVEFIQKPFSMNEIAVGVRRALERT